MQSMTEIATERSLNTSSHDLIRDFFVPLLKASVRYDRGVGYFSSGWLRITAEGMVDFAANGGHARWITSPILNKADWDALRRGETAKQDSVLRAALHRNIVDLSETLEKDTLSALAWLVADEIIEFKLALPRNKLDQGEFHDKFGIFGDHAGNTVSFNGSYNDSIQGTRNYESIKVFRSWELFEVELVRADIERFERLWRDEDENVRVFSLPEAAKAEILQLRASARPYSIPAGSPRAIAVRPSFRPSRPSLPEGLTLRPYQEEAVKEWLKNDGLGIFEMATGTGKTITALAALTQVFNDTGRLIVVVTCPYKHLVTQWAEEASRFGFRPVRVAERKAKWEEELTRQLQAFKRGYSDLVTVVTTNAALTGGSFPEIMQSYWKDSVFVADEAHYAGAPSIRRSLPGEAPRRLGLSATPVRYYDDEGTEALFDYFGRPVFSLPLEEAIGEFLTPYYYYPIPVEMTDDEFDKFRTLSEKIQKFAHAKKDDMRAVEAMEKLAFKRARLQNNSMNKLKWLQNHFEHPGQIEYTLFYVGDMLFPQVKRLLGVEKRLRIHEFTQHQNNRERAAILQRFARGDLQALVAMKCLDEGVDVPPTRTAYFLASSGNPREFVQRRGRVLRKWPGKEHAVVYDLISIPPRYYIEQGSGSRDYSAVRSAVRREYRRIKEFASVAENKYQALDPLFDIASKLDVLTG